MPRVLMERFEELFGVPIVQGWGMTETSPLGRGGPPAPQRCPRQGARLPLKDRTGQRSASRYASSTPRGTTCARDGTSVGEFEIRGPWITGEYYDEPTPERFHDGWLRTGDVGTLDEEGFMQITDRTKDVIKTGGEWISSVELENLLMGHPGVLEAAVVAVADQRWGERPLACVVLRTDRTPSADELAAWLRGKVPSWWVPERWTFVEEIPKTSVGKFDKKVLRAGQEKGELEIVVSERAGS